MPERAWYYAKNDQQVGPVTATDLRTRLASGDVAPNDLVWTDGMPQWASASTVPELTNTQPYPAAAPINYYTPPSATRYPEYAGFWIRFGAAFLDGLIVGGINFATNFIAGFAVAAANGGRGSPGVSFLLFLLNLAVAWIYYASQESSAQQATVGKRAVGVRVCDMEGRRISFGRATGRHFAKYVSGMILMVGYIMAAFSERKQALHDLMASTLVLRN